MDKKKLIIKNKSDLPILKAIKIVYELMENRGGVTWGSGIDFWGAQLTSFYTSEYHVSCREKKHKCIFRFYKMNQFENAATGKERGVQTTLKMIDDVEIENGGE